jgi:hypothetical protein
MPTWLTEDPSPVYLLLGIIALAFFVAYWVKRQRKYLVGVGIVTALVGIVALIDHLVVTDREQIVHHLGEMAEAGSNRDLDRVFRHFSAEFRHQGHDKSSFRQAAERAIRQHNVRDFRIWDLEPVEISSETRTAKAAFKIKFQSDLSRGADFFLCRAEFVLDPDGQWRLKGFQIFNPFVNTDQPLQIPGL